LLTNENSQVVVSGDTVTFTMSVQTAEVMSGLTSVGSAAMLSNTRLAEASAKMLSLHSDLHERMYEVSDILENFHRIIEATAHAG